MTDTDQTAPGGRLRHLLGLQGLPRATLERLLDRAQALHADARGGSALRARLAGRAVCNLFFEPSTRTRTSFRLAALRLGADVVDFDASTSSAKKGESDADTLRTIEAMGVHAFVVRHPVEGAVAALTSAAATGTVLVNGGDGRHEHPTQGLLDMLTIRQAKGPDFARLKVAIVGDLRHSRVARSDLHALRTLGAADIRVCAPAALLPDADELAGCRVTGSLADAVDGADVVMTLRLQRERMEEGLVPSLEEYHRDYGITAARLRGAARDAVVMHPGPMNRGVEIDADVADGPLSLVLRQVANGVAVRMAVLEELLA